MFPIIRNMAKISRIHADKTPIRIHFIKEWIDHRRLSQADVVRDLGVNKGTVSKWCSGELPSEDNLLLLATFLHVDPPVLFRHPEDDWLSHFFRNRSEEELQRMVTALRASFPREEETHKEKSIPTKPKKPRAPKR